jgi:Zn-dependent protease
MGAVVDILLLYLCLIIVITFHEAGHAWVAWKCGDPTAKSQGRVSLNPIVHLDPVGTVALPLLALALAAGHSAFAGFIIGWGRPVPVNPRNLSRPRLHDSLISLAGPGMNIALAFLALLLGKGLLMAGSSLAITAVQLAQISLFLGFFNLLPVPPLDGSHLLKHFTGMSDERYFQIARYGFLIIILLIQIPAVLDLLDFATMTTLRGMSVVMGLR